MPCLHNAAPPAGIQGSSEVYTMPGMDINITAFTDVTGNGSPLASGIVPRGRRGIFRVGRKTRWRLHLG